MFSFNYLNLFLYPQNIYTNQLVFLIAVLNYLWNTLMLKICPAKPNIFIITLLGFVLGFLACIDVSAQSNAIKKTDSNRFSFYESKHNNQTISSVVKDFEQGKFNPIAGNFVNFGRTVNPYWMHFSIYGAEKDENLMLEIDNSHIYDLKVYTLNDSGLAVLLYHTGNDKIFKNRPYPYRNFVFPIQIKAGKNKDYFVSLDRQNEVLKFNIKILEREDFILHQNQTYWLYGGFTGILIFIMLFNIFLWFTLDNKIHIWYILYILFVLLFVLADTGLGYEFLWSNYPEVNMHVRTFTGILAFVLQLHFMQLFISQKQSNSQFYRLVNGNKLIFLLLLCLSTLPFIFNFKFSGILLSGFNTAFSIAYVSGIILVGLSLAEKIYQKNKTGIIYLIAIFPLMLQVLVVILARWKLLSLAIDTSMTMTISILLEIIILTLGLAIRYNYFKIEKDKLEHLLIRQQKSTMEKVISTQEEERRRIAGDLHDDLGGTLASIKGILSGLSPIIENQQAKMLGHSQELIDKACEDLRFIAHDLMPADFSNTQLNIAIKEVVSKLNISTDIKFNYIFAGEYKFLDKKIELNIYRILNELVHNIKKHSNAKTATIQLIYHDDFLQLMVEDDGSGFKTTSAVLNVDGIGLKNIQARIDYINGKIYFDSGSQGSTITCNVPYPQ